MPEFNHSRKMKNVDNQFHNSCSRRRGLILSTSGLGFRFACVVIAGVMGYFVSETRQTFRKVVQRRFKGVKSFNKEFIKIIITHADGARLYTVRPPHKQIHLTK